MNLSAIYRSASKELALLQPNRQLLQKLLRELATNTVQRRLAWNIKTDFITLWFISAGRFPCLPEPITNWVIKQLPFELTEEEQQLLKS
jgi:hypothetical protein